MTNRIQKRLNSDHVSLAVTDALVSLQPITLKNSQILPTLLLVKGMMDYSALVSNCGWIRSKHRKVSHAFDIASPLIIVKKAFERVWLNPIKPAWWDVLSTHARKFAWAEQRMITSHQSIVIYGGGNQTAQDAHLRVFWDTSKIQTMVIQILSVRVHRLHWDNAVQMPSIYVSGLRTSAQVSSTMMKCNAETN